MAEDSRGERLQIMLAEDELVVIDDFRFKARMPSRAAAVRELLKRGLAAEGYPTSVAKTKSSDFGVVDASRTDGALAIPQDRAGKRRRGSSSEGASKA